MNIKLMISGLALIGATAVTAQENQISLGLDLALPMGDFGDVFSLGVGPAAGFELPVGDNLGITAQLAYQILMVKSDFSDFVDKASMIPIQLGVKYYFQDQQEGFYGQAQLGVHMMSSTSPERTDPGFPPFIPASTIPSETNSSTNFSWAIGAGYQLEKLDFSLRYNSISPDSDVEGASASSYLGVRVGYLINLD